jgi:hypothetical protein
MNSQINRISRKRRTACLVAVALPRAMARGEVKDRDMAAPMQNTNRQQTQPIAA